MFLGCAVFHDERCSTVCACRQHFPAANARFFAGFYAARWHFVGTDRRTLGAAFLEMDAQACRKEKIFKKIVKNKKNPFLFACGGIE